MYIQTIQQMGVPYNSTYDVKASEKNYNKKTYSQ